MKLTRFTLCLALLGLAGTASAWELRQTPQQEWKSLMADSYVVGENLAPADRTRDFSFGKASVAVRAGSRARAQYRHQNGTGKLLSHENELGAYSNGTANVLGYGCSLFDASIGAEGIGYVEGPYAGSARTSAHIHLSVAGYVLANHDDAHFAANADATSLVWKSYTVPFYVLLQTPNVGFSVAGVGYKLYARIGLDAELRLGAKGWSRGAELSGALGPYARGSLNASFDALVIRVTINGRIHLLKTAVEASLLARWRNVSGGLALVIDPLSAKVRAVVDVWNPFRWDWDRVLDWTVIDVSVPSLRYTIL